MKNFLKTFVADESGASAAEYALIIAVVGCQKGYFTRGGAEGVGRATTRAVVLASIAILISDFFLTKILF